MAKILQFRRQTTVNDKGTENWRLVSDLTYNSLRSAGEVCRINCPTEPDLLSAIAEGVQRFIADGDIYENVIIEFIRNNPELIGYCIGLCNAEVAKKIIDMMTDTRLNR